MKKTGRPIGSGGKHRSKHLTNEQIDEIEKIFLTGKFSAEQIGEMFLKTGKCIMTNMRKRGHSPTFDPRIARVNDGKFSEPWTEEHSYWLGLLHADGHCASNGYGISLQLQEADGYLVEQFAKFIGLTTPTILTEEYKFIGLRGVEYTARPSRIARFSSKKMHADLSQMGIVTRNKQVWIPPVGFRDYLRGMFDGNGCLSKGKRSGTWCWYYTGGMPACKLFYDTWSSMGVPCRIKKSQGCYTVVISSSEGAMKAQAFMYEGNKGPQMHRKAIFTPSEHLWESSGRIVPSCYATSWDNEKKRWQVRVSENGSPVRIGRYKTKGMAWAAYAKYSLKRYGRKSPFWRSITV